VLVISNCSLSTTYTRASLRLLDDFVFLFKHPTNWSIIMTTLVRTTRPNVYVLAAPGFAAALTRSGGVPSPMLRGRLLVALNLQVSAEIKFSKSPKSGKWYVYAAPAATTPVAADLDCAACNDNGCDACDPGAPTLNELYTDLESHDWFFNFSDDARVWKRGTAEHDRLTELAASIPGGTDLMTAYSTHIFSVHEGRPDAPKPARPEAGITITSKVQDTDTDVDGNIACGRCAGTGRYVTRVENGVATGPGGACYRCAGKGHHTHADRARNLHHDTHFIPSLV
jgi:hypothetical protein